MILESMSQLTCPSLLLSTVLIASTGVLLIIPTRDLYIHIIRPA